MRKTIRTIVITAALTLTATASVALACEGEQIAKLAGVAVSRCAHREVTISVDGPLVQRDGRTYVTINDKDARELYETLAPYYGKDKR